MEEQESPPSAFDAIAPAWYNFRHYTLFDVELSVLAKRWGGGKLLNLGCGHGADFLPFREGFLLYGLDYSSGMLTQARRFAAKHNFNVLLAQGDLRSLPYESNMFDNAIAVATYHHIKGGENHAKALSELRRVIKPDGEAFITVWNRCQTRFWLKKKEILLPFKVKEEIIQRYYYLFTFGEIERIAREAGFAVISSRPESKYRFPIRTFARNICLLLKKMN